MSFLKLPSKMLEMWCILILCACFEPAIGGYTFYRRLREKELDLPVTRRLFGGHSVNPEQYPNLVVLVDHSMTPKCTGSIIARRWVVTAAHCATPEVAYVRYNFKAFDQSDLAPIHLLYQHPKYRVVTSDEGQGEDVVVLQHDVGLVRTRTNMILMRVFQKSKKTSTANADVETDILEGMSMYSTTDMISADIEILGYGRTENTSQGSELRLVKLKVAMCERSAESWVNCACALGDARGVCAGDSGGPVMHKGKQVGVTSMGPMSCSPVFLTRGGDTKTQVSSSVFTSLYPYAKLINDTIFETEDTMKMRILKSQYEIENSAKQSSAERLLFILVLCGSYVWVRLN